MTECRIANPPLIERVSWHVYLLKGAVNTGIVISCGHAILFNCYDTAAPAVLPNMGVERVDMVCFTSYRRM